MKWFVHSLRRLIERLIERGLCGDSAFTDYIDTKSLARLFEAGLDYGDLVFRA